MDDAPTSQPGRHAVMATFNGVETFRVTGSAGPEQGARRILEWLFAHPRREVRDVTVTQSNHRADITITLFFWEER